VHSSKRNLVSLAGELTPLLSGAVLFFLLIGILPTAEYGVFVAVTASAMIISPIARAGAGVVLLRDIGASRPDEPAWNDALSTTIVTTSLAVAVWAIIGTAIVPGIPAAASVALFWQQLVPLALSDLVTTHLVVKNDLVTSLRARLTFAVWRIIGLLVFWALDSSSLNVLGFVLLTTGLIGAGINVGQLSSKFNVKSRFFWPGFPTIVRGIPDSVSAATGSILDSVDKPLLLRAGFDTDTARYGVAMRLVSLAGVPTLALLRPFDQETFRAGAESVTATTKVMVRAATRTFPVSLVAAGTLWLLAGLLPQLLPTDYAESTDILRWGVWMIPMRALSFPFGNVLTAAGHRATRLVITAIAAGGNVIANLILIPRYSWRAAVGTTLAAELLMVVATMGSCWILVRREQR